MGYVSYEAALLALDSVAKRMNERTLAEAALHTRRHSKYFSSSTSPIALLITTPSLELANVNVKLAFASCLIMRRQLQLTNKIK